MRLRNILILSAVIHLVLVPFIFDEFNTWGWMSFPRYLLDGYNPYSVTYTLWSLQKLNLLPYPPPFYLLLIPAELVYEHCGNTLAFIYLSRLPMIIANLVSVYLTYKIAMLQSNNEKLSGRLALFIAVNPLMMLVAFTSTDSLPIACTLAAVYYFIRDQNGRAPNRGFLLSAFYLGLGIAFKQFPVVLIPVFLARMKGFRSMAAYVAMTAVPLLAFSLPFFIWDPYNYERSILGFHIGGPQSYGPVQFQTRPVYSVWALITQAIYGSVYKADPDFVSTITTVGLVVMAMSILLLFIYMRYKGTSVVVGITLTFLLMYLLLPLNKAHYFVYCIPFAFLLLTQTTPSKSRIVRFLPYLFWVPSLLFILVMNGMYGNDLGGRAFSDGSAGFFYFFHRWLHMDKVAFSYLGGWNSWWTWVPFANIVLCLFFIAALLYVTRQSRKASDEAPA